MAAFRKSFGALRLLIGILFLCAPGLGSSLFLIRYAPGSSLPGRLFGVREAVLGSLLLYARKAEVVKSLYVQSIAIDSLDFIATALCCMEGNLDILPATSTVGGGILILLIMGLLGFQHTKNFQQFDTEVDTI